MKTEYFCILLNIAADPNQPHFSHHSSHLSKALAKSSCVRFLITPSHLVSNCEGYGHVRQLLLRQEQEKIRGSGQLRGLGISYRVLCQERLH
jgi:hypothetical protein